MDDDPVLTIPQWLAARMLVARLGAEAFDSSGINFDLAMLGMEFLPIEDSPVAFVDDQEIMIGDLIYAAMVLLWSMVCQTAEDKGQDPSEIVSGLGIGLALAEP